MTAQRLLHIAIALLAVLILWVLVEIFGPRSDVVDVRPLLIPMRAEAVDRVEIVGPGDTIRLSRTPSGAWTVNGHAAAPSMIDELFDALDDSTVAQLVAQSASSHERMGVDSASGKHVRIVGGGQELLHLIAGERGVSFRSRYVRLSGDDEVYLLEGALVPAFDRSLTDWRDKVIAAIEPDSIVRIRVDRKAGGYEIERRDSTTWRFAAGAPVDSAAIRRTLEAYRSLAAQGGAFATAAQIDSADFTRPDRRVTLVGGRGDTLLALLLDSTETGFWVRHAAGGTVFELFRWKGDEIAPADSVLRGQ